MNPVHAILIVIIRLWAAGITITSVQYISIWPILYTGINNDANNYAILVFIFSGIWVVMGIVAWLAAPRFAKAVYKSKANDPLVGFKVEADTLVKIGSFLIGVFYFVEYAPTLITKLVFVLNDNSKNIDGSPLPISARTIEEVVIVAFIVLIALLMMLRSADVAKIFSWLRSAGQYQHKGEGEK